VGWLHAHAETIGIAGSVWMVFAAAVGFYVRRWRERADDDQ
jgi:hypothetical protein